MSAINKNIIKFRAVQCDNSSLLIAYISSVKVKKRSSHA